MRRHSVSTTQRAHRSSCVDYTEQLLGQGNAAGVKYISLESHKISYNERRIKRLQHTTVPTLAIVVIVHLFRRTPNLAHRQSRPTIPNTNNDNTRFSSTRRNSTLSATKKRAIRIINNTPTIRLSHIPTTQQIRKE